MYKEDLALDNLQWLIYHKTKLFSETVFIHPYPQKIFLQQLFLLIVNRNSKTNDINCLKFQIKTELILVTECIYWNAYLFIKKDSEVWFQ